MWFHKQWCIIFYTMFCQILHKLFKSPSITLGCGGVLFNFCVCEQRLRVRAVSACSFIAHAQAASVCSFFACALYASQEIIFSSLQCQTIFWFFLPNYFPWRLIFPSNLNIWQYCQENFLHCNARWLILFFPKLFFLESLISPINLTKFKHLALLLRECASVRVSTRERAVKESFCVACREWTCPTLQTLNIANVANIANIANV
jgi:hypothetical protein